MEIDAKETANQLARDSSPHPLTEPQPALCISAKVARGKIRDWTSREHEDWQSTHGPKAS
jgi:hypothetical protein